MVSSFRPTTGRAGEPRVRACRPRFILSLALAQILAGQAGRFSLQGRGAAASSSRRIMERAGPASSMGLTYPGSIHSLSPEQLSSPGPGGGIFTSTNGGASWNEVNTGLTDLMLSQWQSWAQISLPGLKAAGCGDDRCPKSRRWEVERPNCH